MGGQSVQIRFPELVTPHIPSMPVFSVAERSTTPLIVGMGLLEWPSHLSLSMVGPLLAARGVVVLPTHAAAI